MKKFFNRRENQFGPGCELNNSATEWSPSEYRNLEYTPGVKGHLFAQFPQQHLLSREAVRFFLPYCFSRRQSESLKAAIILNKKLAQLRNVSVAKDVPVLLKVIFEMIADEPVVRPPGVSPVENLLLLAHTLLLECGGSCFTLANRLRDDAQERCREVARRLADDFYGASSKKLADMLDWLASGKPR